LEFKACGAWSKNPEAKKEIGKDVSAMANAAGGIIIYGIKEKERIADAIDMGFDPNAYTKESLEQIIDSNVQPRIEGLRISVVPLRSRGNNVAYVVEVPQAISRAPHQASDFRYYKRANFLNQAMEDYEIRDALRRARWPDLYLTWSVETMHQGAEHPIGVQLTADIDNRSSEPAHYSTCRVYFDAALTMTSRGDAWDRHGGQAFPNGEKSNAYVRQLMVPNDFPIIREQTHRIGTFFLNLPRNHPTQRFVIGSSVRAPGCERDEWATIVLQQGAVHLGGYRIRS
jgi:hypothetical protein